MDSETVLIIVIGVLFLALALASPISNIVTKKRGEKFLEEHPDAIRIYKAKLRRKRMEFELHKSYAGRYARFIEGKREGLLLLPEQLYDFRLKCIYGKGNTTITASLMYNKFVSVANKTFIASYDSDTKTFSLVEGIPE